MTREIMRIKLRWRSEIEWNHLIYYLWYKNALRPRQPLHFYSSSALITLEPDLSYKRLSYWCKDNINCIILTFIASKYLLGSLYCLRLSRKGRKKVEVVINSVCEIRTSYINHPIKIKAIGVHLTVTP